MVAATTCVETVGVGCAVGGAIGSLGSGLEAGAPIVRRNGARAKKIRDIARKIQALVKLIKESKSIKERMLGVGKILDEASKINNNKELKQAADLVKDTIKVVEASIKHAEILMEAVKKGDLIAGIRASVELGKDVAKGKKILESGKDLFEKAKALLTPEAKKQREEDKVKKEQREKKRIEEGGETRSHLKKLKSELFAMAEERNLNPSPRLLKADLITLLLNNPKGKSKETPKIPPLPSKKEMNKKETKKETPKIPPLPERKVKKKTHRKPSKYNIFMGEKMREGNTFKESVALWRLEKSK